MDNIYSPIKCFADIIIQAGQVLNDEKQLDRKHNEHVVSPKLICPQIIENKSVHVFF